MEGKYKGFQTMRFVGVFNSDGEEQPLSLGLSASAATDALIRETMERTSATFEEARSSVERLLANGNLFHAPVALCGAFRNDAKRESEPRKWWINAALLQSA